MKSTVSPPPLPYPLGNEGGAEFQSLTKSRRFKPRFGSSLRSKPSRRQQSLVQSKRDCSKRWSMIVAAHEYTLPRRNTTLAACLSVFIGTQVFLIIVILRNAHGLIAMHPNAARCNAMTSPVSRYARMLAPVSRCAGPCPDAGAAIAMYFTSSRCRRPYRDAGQPPRCNKIIAGKFTFLLM